MQIDSLPYKVFQKMKTKYSPKMVLITEQQFATPGLRRAFRDHRTYIEHLFAKEGVEIIRFAHNYKSLDTRTPELGLVFLANDSVINPGVEVWALIGHNARWKNDKAEDIEGL